MKKISLKFILIIFLLLSACSDPIYKMHSKNDLLNLSSEKEIDFELSPIHKVMYDLSIKLAKSIPFFKERLKTSSKNPEELNQIISTENEIKEEKEANSHYEKIQKELHSLIGRIQRLNLKLKRKFLVEPHEKEAVNKISNHFFRLQAFFDEKIPIDKLEKEMKELSSKIQLWEDKLNNWN